MEERAAKCDQSVAGSRSRIAVAVSLGMVGGAKQAEDEADDAAAAANDVEYGLLLLLPARKANAGAVRERMAILMLMDLLKLLIKHRDLACVLCCSNLKSPIEILAGAFPT